MKHTLFTALLFVPLTTLHAVEPGTQNKIEPADADVLNFHLMHPGGGSSPGDPNAAFYLDGTYHLHYILSHKWKDKGSFSFVHVTSPDMLHWTWQPTKLQPSFTGHGMFSGTGFITKEGKPAAIYHGQGSGIWGYQKADDDKHLDADETLRRLAQAFGQNCNLLMNTGPLPDGSIHPVDEKTLREVGRRIRANGWPAPMKPDPAAPKETNVKGGAAAQ